MVGKVRIRIQSGISVQEEVVVFLYIVLKGADI